MALGSPPRVRGTDPDHPAVQGRGGSPPRVRGTDANSFIVSCCVRITPACAGNSQIGRPRVSSQKDHPRVCGEQEVLPSHRYPSEGSPPRVRGTASGSPPPPGHSRITPACAGNRRSAMQPCGQWRDHPRVCGEQPHPAAENAQLPGSPPRVRGTESPNTYSAPSIRITPACAGNSPRDGVCIGILKDHPRVCGEQLFPLFLFQPRLGSPPRVRGTASSGRTARGNIRITPACAGNSCLPFWLNSLL